MTGNQEACVTYVETAHKQRESAFRSYWYLSSNPKSYAMSCTCFPSWFYGTIKNLRKSYLDLRWINTYNDFLKRIADEQHIIFRS